MKEALTTKNLIIYLIAAIMGGSGSIAIRAIDPPRPDPFTGSQASELKERIVALETNQKLLMDWFYKTHYRSTSKKK